MPLELSVERLHSHHHAVQFYGHEASLFTNVAGFLSEGLAEGQPAILIATPAHTRRVLEHLKERLIDVEAVQRTGGLVVQDARQTLALFMRDGWPDPNAFESTVGALVAQVFDGSPGRTLARAYGEMVNVLWKDGREEAAIQLEILWNRLATRYPFAVLCSYSMEHFARKSDLFEEVCRQHTHIVPPDMQPGLGTAKRSS